MLKLDEAPRLRDRVLAAHPIDQVLTQFPGDRGLIDTDRRIDGDCLLDLPDGVHLLDDRTQWQGQAGNLYHGECSFGGWYVRKLRSPPVVTTPSYALRALLRLAKKPAPDERAA